MRASVTVAVRVRPGAARPGVGGRRGDALVVAVRERAVDGQATEAALRALAAAFDVPRSAVRLRRGAASRDKLVDVEGDEQTLRRCLHSLLAG